MNISVNRDRPWESRAFSKAHNASVLRAQVAGGPGGGAPPGGQRGGGRPASARYLRFKRLPLLTGGAEAVQALGLVMVLPLMALAPCAAFAATPRRR